MNLSEPGSYDALNPSDDPALHEQLEKQDREAVLLEALDREAAEAECRTCGLRSCAVVIDRSGFCCACWNDMCDATMHPNQRRSLCPTCEDS